MGRNAAARPDSDRPRWSTNKPNPMLAAAIRAALGLSETATEEDAVAAIKALTAAKEQAALNAERAPSLKLYVPRDDYNALEQCAVNAEQQFKQRDKDDQGSLRLAPRVSAANQVTRP